MKASVAALAAVGASVVNGLAIEARDSKLVTSVSNRNAVADAELS